MLSNVYPQEFAPGIRHNTPGRSLYVVQKFQVVEVPFAWLWKCSILASPADGGAPLHWLADMSKDNAIMPSCALSENTDQLTYDGVFRLSSNFLQRFMHDMVIYEYNPPVPLKWADRILHDTNHLLTEIISHLQVDTSNAHCIQMLFKHARKVLFNGNDMELLWPTWTLRDWIDRGIIIKRTPTQQYRHYDTIFPLYRFAALIDIHHTLSTVLAGLQLDNDVINCRYTSNLIKCIYLYDDDRMCTLYDPGMMDRIESFNDNITSTVGNGIVDILAPLEGACSAAIQCTAAFAYPTLLTGLACTC
jgi:hypothetical protein